MLFEHPLWVLGCLTVAVVLRGALGPLFHERGWGLYLMAAVAASWAAGLQTGLLALALGLFAASVCYLPVGYYPGQLSHHVASSLAFVIVGATLVAMVASVRTHRLLTGRVADEAATRREWLDAVLSSIGDAVIVTDPTDHILEMNDAAERLTGWKRIEALGRQRDEVAKLLGEDSQQTYEHEVLDPLAPGAAPPASEPAMLQRYDGLRVPVDTRTTPIRHADQSIAGFAFILRDETERRRADRALRDSERRLRLMADTAPVLIWMTERDGRWSYANRAYAAFAPATSDSTLESAMGAILHPDDCARVQQAYQRAYDDRQPFTHEYRLRRHDSSDCWLLESVVPRADDDGNFDGFLGCAIDISELRCAERRLREANHRKDEFMAVMAHELRNPLAAVRSTIEHLELEQRKPDATARALPILNRQVGQLVRLINDLLDVSRIERGKIGLQKRLVPVQDVVGLAIETATPALEAQGHHFDLELPDTTVHVDADPTRLVQVLSNLLLNAARFTDPGGVVALRVEPQDAQVLFQVCDTGIGIEPEMLTLIFEPFRQVERFRARSQGGLGLGLALVKRLVELHGGRVVAESEGPGTGSRFSVWIPKWKGESPKAKPSEERRASAQRRILVADDNQDAADSLAHLLRLIGNDVRVVYDGKEALDALTSDPPDLAILDVGMPEMSGYEVVRQARDRFSARRPYLVALTGWANPEDREYSRQAGFDLHLVKPVDLEMLCALMRTIAPSTAGNA